MNYTDADVVALYRSYRDKVHEIEEESKTKLEPYKEQMKAIELYFLNIMNERGQDNFRTENGMVYKSKIMRVSCADRLALIDFVLAADDAGAFDIFTNALSKDFVAKHIERHKVAPPGVMVEYVTNVNIRK